MCGIVSLPHKLLKGQVFPHLLLTAPLAWLDPRLCGDDETQGTF